MGRPAGIRREGSLLARRAKAQATKGIALYDECHAQFRETFDRRWTMALAEAMLEDDALTISAALSRSYRAKEDAARAALHVLRTAALRVKRLRDAGDLRGDIAAAIDYVVNELPEELVSYASPPWSKARSKPQRLRVMLNAPRVLARELEPRELALVGVLAGVRVNVRKDDTVASVLRREARAYASLRCRHKR